MDPITLSALISSAAIIGAPIANRLIEGSPEDQFRKQAKIQEEIESERMARESGRGIPGLVGGRATPLDLESLIGEEELTRRGAGLARKMYSARTARNPVEDKLDEILGESTARIAAIQSERVLTPIEIIQMMEMAGG